MHIATKETRDYLQALAELYWFLHTKTNTEAIAGLAEYSELKYNCTYVLNGMKLFCDNDKEKNVNEEIGRLLNNVNVTFERLKEAQKNEELLTLAENV